MREFRLLPRRSVAITFRVMSLCLMLAATARADLRENFESADTAWQYLDADCQVQIVRHKRAFNVAHTGHGSEHVIVSANAGTFVHFAYPIGRAPVIRELVPSLWVRSDRPGLQLMARVVLPRTTDRQTGRPLTTLVRGTSYSRTGQWEQLTITDLPLLLERHLRSLRQQHGPQVDEREAFIDRLVVNVYGGAGLTQVWFDDLEIDGPVMEADSKPHADATTRFDSAVRPAQFTEPVAGTSSAATSPRLEGSVLVAGGRPFMPRVIEHNGEAFEWLKLAGFNTIKLRVSPSPADLQEATRLGLWLIAPPPHTAGRPIASQYNPVLAWSLGVRLSEREVRTTQRLADEIRTLDPLRRPLVCGADSRLWTYSNCADILLLEPPPLFGSFELTDVGSWLRERPRLARLGTPIWAGLDTEPPEPLVEQLRRLDGGTLVKLEPEQLRLLVYHTVAAGVRGVLFKSRSRLDGDDTASRMRAATLTLLNQELAAFEPWVAGGSFTEEFDTGDGHTHAYVMQTERARLMLVLRQGRGQQFVVGPFGQERMSFVVPGTSASADVYHLSLAGLESLPRRRTAGGLRVSLDNVGLTTALVTTENPLVVNHLARSLNPQRREVAKIAAELLGRRLAEIDDTQRRLTELNRSAQAATQGLQLAQGNASQMTRMLETGDLRQASVFLARATDGFLKTQRSYWDEAVRAFPSPVASPFCTNFATLPAHWRLADRMRNSQWTPNYLSGGEFEDLKQVLASGWRQNVRDLPEIETHVELSAETPHGGRAALRMKAWSRSQRPPQIVEAAPVWISSGPLHVREGQLLRIHGWARVRQPLTGTRDGLLIFESFGGLPLAERILKTDEWQPFTLYRVATSSGEFTLTFALTGLGDASVDDVSVSILEASALPSSGSVGTSVRNASNP